MLASILSITMIAVLYFSGNPIDLVAQQVDRVQVAATVETESIPSAGDAADDPAIWIHPLDPAQSTIIGTDKKGGLSVFDLSGAMIQYRPDGALNNVDLRYNFPLDGRAVALVTAGNRTDNTIAVYRVEPDTRHVEKVAAPSLRPQLEIYGSCMYRSPQSGKYYVFVDSKQGEVEQWEIYDINNSNGTVAGALVRSFDVGDQVEGCVADDELMYLYIGEEETGIWKYGAEPGDGTARTLVDSTGEDGHLRADVEGLTLYYGSANSGHATGYLIASSQGNDTYVIYERRGDNAYVATFEIDAGNGIDRVTHSDGIDVTNVALGSAFPQGVFIAQDDANDDDHQNYKLVPWPAIANATQPALLIDTAASPRRADMAQPNALWSLLAEFLPASEEMTTVAEPLGPPANSETATQPQPAETHTTGEARGYQTTPQELVQIQQKATQGIQPYQLAVAHLMKQAGRKWDYTLDAYEKCKGADSPSWLDEEKGIPRLYARALAYHLSGDETYAQEAADILQRIMTEVEQMDIKEQQCRLNLGWSTPELVATADLIEDYWHEETCTGPTSTLYEETAIGSGNCKVLFQNWLIKNAYYIVSYTAEDAQSNWGAAATNATAYIADYLWDRPETLLRHRMPLRGEGEKFEVITLTPSEAYAHARQLMLDRMNGYRVDLHSSSSCDYLEGDQQNDQWVPVKSQITELGIIPEDARREEYCNVPEYNGEYQNYPQIHLGNNVQQCELMLRRGDAACYDNVDLTDLPGYTFLSTGGVEKMTHLHPGRGSIERGIKAIIVDSQTEWKHDSALEMAYRYYYNHHTLPGFEKWFSQLDRPGGCDQDVCFGTLTHGFAADETPELPPTVPAP